MLYQEQEQYDNLKTLMEEANADLIDDANWRDTKQKIFENMNKFYTDSALLKISGKIENNGQIYLNGRIRTKDDSVIVSGNGKIINYDIGPSLESDGNVLNTDTFINYIGWRAGFEQANLKDMLKDMSGDPSIIPTVSKSMWTINIKNTKNTITSVYDKYEVAKKNNQTDNKGKKWQWSDLEPLTYLSTNPWALFTRKKPTNMC